MKAQYHIFKFPLQILFVVAFLTFFQNNSFSQVQVGVTVTSGNSTTTCGDIFGAPDPLWRVRVGTGAWETYSNGNANNCYTNYPNVQWAFPFDCAQDVPASIQVCFRSFENDGFGCGINETCLEEECQLLIVPAAGNIANYTVAIPAGGASGGEVNIAIGAVGTPLESLNDGICSPENLGVLPSGGSLGNSNAGGFNNICASNTAEPTPSSDGGWVNNQGVWFEFTTSATPGYEILIEAENDPQGLGNPMNIEMAVYESDDGTCNGNMTLLNSSFDAFLFDEFLTLDCPSPNTSYFVVIDGNDFSDEMEGHFGIQISDNGAVAAADTKCEAFDLGMIPVGGNATLTNLHNECADNIGDPNPSAFVSQKSVWFVFQAPPSGSVSIDVLSVDAPPINNGIGAQIGLYRSVNNSCNGFFLEVASAFTNADGNDETLEAECLTAGDNYWILVDGSGSNTAGLFDIMVTDLENYPPETINDTIVCFGETVSVGNSTYTTSGNYTYVFNLLSGCDSTVITNLVVADLLEVEAQQATLASSPVAADGAVTANPTGGTAPFTYLWSNGPTSQLNDNIPPGNYCVTVTDFAGCTAEDCVDLEFSILTSSANGDALDCFNDMDGTFSFSVEDGTAPYNYSYSNLGGTITGSGVINTDGEIVEINNLPAGSYQVDFEDAIGNTTFAFSSITEPAEIITNQDFTLCFGDEIMIGNTIYNSTGAINEILPAANGCDSSVTGLLTILPDPAFLNTTSICFGENISVATSIYNATGIYSDTLQTTQGCDSIITTNLTVLDEITVSINVDVLPSGYIQPDGTITASAIGGAGGFSFEWSDTQVGATANNVLGGTDYCVIATDANGCTSQICSTILYDSNIALALNDTLDCFGDTDGQISLGVANGLGAYNFDWENLDSGLTGNGAIPGNFGNTLITNLPKGNYSITVTDTYVSTVISAEVVEPALLEVETISAQNVSCIGDCDGSVILNPSGGIAPYTYAWSGGIAPVQEPINLCAIDYMVTVTDSKACTAILNISMPEPAPFSANIFEVEPISCGGASDGGLVSTPFGGTGSNFSFNWNTNSDSNFLGGLSTGNYSVTITDEAGCTAEATYNLPEPTPINFDLNVTDVNCWNGLSSGIVALENITGGTGPYVYALGQNNSYQTIEIFNQLEAGSYQVYVQDANGCVENDVAIVGLPQLVEVNLGDDYEINLGESVELEVFNISNDLLIEWNVDSCQNCPIIEATPLNSTTFSVSVLDTITGCSDSDILTVYVSKDRKVFIPNAFSPDGNGINDFVTVFADAKSVQNIRNFRIFNRWGALVFEKENMMPNQESEGWNGFLNNKKMQTGVYIYSVEIEFIDGKVELFKGDITLTP